MTDCSPATSRSWPRVSAANAVRFTATPDPDPAVLLARLAVATGAQGRGLGRALVEHAWRTCQAVSEQIGVRGLLVDATDENATRFYRSCDFVPIATGQPTLARILTG